MKKKVLISIVLVATLILAATLIAWGFESSKQNGSLAKTYVYEKGGFGSDFSLTLNEDGTFTYYAGMLSSYIGYGKWSVQGNILTITETNDRVNRFRINGDDLVFISEGSENFMYVKVGDGERFIACPVVPSDTSDAE